MATSLKRSENKIDKEKDELSSEDSYVSDEISDEDYEISDEDDDVSDVDDEKKPITHKTKNKSNSKKKSKKNDDECDKQNEESHIDCPICLGPATLPIRIPCGHIFCFICVKGAARQAKKCPMCREHISVDFDKNPDLLERHDIEKIHDGHQWYYEGKNGWWQYEKRTSEEIEGNFKENIKKFDLLICGTIYTIDLERNVQYNRENPTKRRRLKRESANNIAVKGVAGVH